MQSIHQNLMGKRLAALREEESQKSSTNDEMSEEEMAQNQVNESPDKSGSEKDDDEPEEEEIDDGMGLRQSHISLLDQHSELKKKAEGINNSK